MKKLSRRDFLKGTAATAGAVAVGKVAYAEKGGKGKGKPPKDRGSTTGGTTVSYGMTASATTLADHSRLMTAMYEVDLT